MAQNVLTEPGSVAAALASARMVDLTHTLEENYPTQGPWLPPFRHVVYNWYEPRPDDAQRLLSRSYTQVSGDGRETHGVYYSCWMTIFEHCGTHFDAPTHAIPPSDSGLPHANEWGDVYGDMVPLEKFQGPLAVVDARFLREGPQRERHQPAARGRAPEGVGGRARRVPGRRRRRHPHGLGRVLRPAARGQQVPQRPVRRQHAGLADAVRGGHDLPQRQGRRHARHRRPEPRRVRRHPVGALRRPRPRHGVHRVPDAAAGAARSGARTSSSCRRRSRARRAASGARWHGCSTSRWPAGHERDGRVRGRGAGHPRGERRRAAARRAASAGPTGR